MKILFIGDIVGKASRKKIKEIIPTLKSKYNTDMIIANGENATSGYGLSKKDAEELFSSGIDILTLGNHAWDQRDMLSYICLLYTSPSPRDQRGSRMPSSA